MYITTLAMTIYLGILGQACIKNIGGFEEWEDVADKICIYFFGFVLSSVIMDVLGTPPIIYNPWTIITGSFFVVSVIAMGLRGALNGIPEEKKREGWEMLENARGLVHSISLGVAMVAMIVYGVYRIVDTLVHL